MVRYRGNTPSSKAYYSCNAGYELKGLKWRKCLYDGTWYGSAPTCLPIKSEYTIYGHFNPFSCTIYKLLIIIHCSTQQRSFALTLILPPMAKFGWRAMHLSQSLTTNATMDTISKVCSTGSVWAMAVGTEVPPLAFLSSTTELAKNMLPSRLLNDRLLKN